jgi:hypothetical protein
MDLGHHRRLDPTRACDKDAQPDVHGHSRGSSAGGSLTAVRTQEQFLLNVRADE